MSSLQQESIVDFDVDESLKRSIIEFFSHKPHIERIFPIVNRTSTISLRILEYFAVNYTRMNPVLCRHNGQVLDVYESYRKQLKMVSKNVFDPFRRGEKFMMRFDNSKTITTTWGQLCFFKWLLQYRILDYIEGHLADIQADMKKYLSKENHRRSVVKQHVPSSLPLQTGLLHDSIQTFKKTTKKRDNHYTAIRTDSPSDDAIKYTVTFN